MKKHYLFILLILGFSGMVWAQPTFQIDNSTGNPGGTVAVNFKVNNFSNIVGMQFSINWDPTVLKFASLSNITNALRDFDAASFNTDSKFTNVGQMIVTWFDTGAEPNTLPNGTTIFTINFDIVGGPGAITTVTISDVPRKIEVLNNNEMNVGLQASGGDFTATGSGGGATLRLLGSDEMGETGENVCVEVTVQGFTNINGMQFSINWDPAFLRYTGVSAFNLNGLTQASFNENATSTGKLGVQWLDPSSSGVTLSNNTRIFHICFDILGATGSRTVQFTNDPVAIEIVDGNDNRVNFSKKDGTITVGGGGGGSDCDAAGFALAASEEQGATGTEVCVDITVKGFNKITSLATSIEWNPAVMGNPRINAITLAGLTDANFNLDQASNGRLSIIWIDPSTDGVTLADGAKIFEICFNVTGTNGQTSPVRFTDILTVREVSADGVAITFNQCDGNVTVGTGGTSISGSVQQPSCKGSADGAINITVNGGTSPFTFAWTKNGAAAGTSEDLNNLTAGTYVVRATDAAGMTFTQEFILNDPGAVSITNAVIVDATSGNNGSIALTLSGGNTPFQFAWSNGSTTRDIAGLDGGAYSLTITEANGCTLDTSFTVGGGELRVTLNIDHVSCFNERDGMVIANVSGGMPPYSYAWSVTGQTNMSIGQLGPGNYTVTVTDAAGTRVSTNGQLNQPDQLSVTVTTTPSPNNVEGTASAVVSGGTTPYTYSWTDAAQSRTRVIINLPEGTYRVIVQDANGCMATASGIVSETPKECFTSISVMTPNSDGRNDVFDIACISGTDNEVEIYNRHGDLVFEAVNYENNWTGLDSAGEVVPDGPYYWVVRVRRNGVLEQFLGHVTILTTLN